MLRTLQSAGWDDFKKKGDVKIIESISNEFKPSLIRGLIDGDGSIKHRRWTGQLVISFVDINRKPVSWLQKTLISELHFKPNKVMLNKRKNAYLITYGGEKAELILKYITSTSGPRLERKYLFIN
jgi:hypothetical protein